MQDDYRHHNNHSTPTPLPANREKQLNIPMAESIQLTGKNLDKFSASFFGKNIKQLLINY
jgi:hypothetical protein